jgi:tRNA G10  N-methylase Trm11
MKEYLAYFASKNFEFRVPELYSIAKCLGLELSAEAPFTENEFHVRGIRMGELDSIG